MHPRLTSARGFSRWPIHISRRFMMMHVETKAAGVAELKTVNLTLSAPS